MEATYNLTDNRLKLWPPTDRLTAEQDAQRKATNFAWWPGRKCFAVTWSPQAEDFVKSFGIEITEDDTPDDLEARVERFQGYADRDERDADSAAQRVLSATTTRRAEQAEATATKKLDEARYWQQRIAGAIRHATHKDAPGTIARRIKTLEADLRKQQRAGAEAKTRTDWYFGDWKHARGIDYDVRAKDLTPEQLKDAKAYVKAQVDAVKARAARWIAHLEMRLEYERAYLAAVGGDPVANLGDLKAGDKVLWRGEECEVVKVNKTTVQAISPSHRWCKNGLKIDKTELKLVEAEA